MPGSTEIKFAASAMEHCYIHYTRKSIYSPFMQIQVSELAGCQNTQMRAAADVLMEKNDKTNISKDH